jgi:hypothetical protein
VNTLFRILIRRQDELWVYDDASFGVREQPFVFGADLILDKMAAKFEGAGDGLNLVFSSIPFPGSEFCLEFVREETQGFVYRWVDHNLQGWMSPSLRNYFPDPPPKIYLQLLPVE